MSARWPTDPIAYGGDYNPEQWPEQVWADDVQLMQEAGVNLVSVGIFSWGLLEVADGEYDFGWLDRVLDLLHAGGIGVDLATPSAAPPVWLHQAHPEILPVDREGRRYSQGSRETWCPSSPVLRRYAVRIATVLAERYGTHPAVKMWHISNELGCHNGRCYCETSAEAFRRWLGSRYGAVDALNAAWGTAFWGQHYTSFEQVLPPRATVAFNNPGQSLDFERFSSDELVAHLDAEREVLRRITPDLPVTTNFMVMSGFRHIDYAEMAQHVDLVSTDHYVEAENVRGWAELAFSADRTRGIAGGEPWLLMEHSTSAVNWQPRNLAKEPGEMLRNSLAHVARGADGVLFFQWRQSRSGAEKFHSAMVPHVGRDSELFREVVRLGDVLGRLAEVRGSVVERADIAILLDQDAWWASELDAHPTLDFHYLDQARLLHRTLLDQGVAVDVLPADADLGGYRAVLVPSLYLTRPTTAQAIAAVAERGGHVLVTYFSGIVDETDSVLLGGYPGAFRNLLGVRVEEFAPLREGEQAELDGGWVGEIWSERLLVVDAEVVAAYRSGPSRGGPAVTRRVVGAGGSAWYVSTRLDEASSGALLERFLAEASVQPITATVAGVEVVRRRGERASYLFLINHTEGEVKVPTSGIDLITGTEHDGVTPVAAGGVVVLRQATEVNG